MAKINQKEEKRVKNEEYALKYKKHADKAAKKKAQRLETIEKQKKAEVEYWEKESKRRLWPEGHPNNAL